jgi:hypothetical protein
MISIAVITVGQERSRPLSQVIAEDIDMGNATSFTKSREEVSTRTNALRMRYM